MLCVEARFFCILIAAIGSAAGSSAPEVPFSFRADAEQPAYKDILGPSFPNDTVYVEYSAPVSDLMMSIVDVAQIVESTFEMCKYQATSRGGNLFEFVEASGNCTIATLKFPLCRTRQGQQVIYIQPQFLTNGTDDDGTIVGNLSVAQELSSLLSNSSDDYGTHTVQSVAISTSRPNYYSSADKHCGKVVRFRQGQRRYLLSHQSIGCQYFFDEGYKGTCRVNYRGFNNRGIKITVALVNFVGDDSCDGFSLTVVSYNTQTNRTVTRLCNTSVTEIFSPVSRGRIDFSGNATTDWQKYGFIIILRDA